MNKKKKLINALRLPENTTRLLLHSCCAPCAADIMLRIKQAEIPYSLFFYNPNIHPKAEYLMRKDENKRYADKLGVEFIDADYDRKNWFSIIKGLENEPERGERCRVCFEMRFLCTAAYAKEYGFDVISSTLGISRWKDFEQVTRAGEHAASLVPNLCYWSLNWRKGGGSNRMIELSKEEQFYQQEYCGCIYSLRDTNLWREQNNRTKIVPLVKRYAKASESC